MKRKTMESSLRKLYVQGGKMKENIMKVESSDDEGGEEDMALINKEDPLTSTRAEMGEAIQENQRLRMNLDKIKKEYQALQMQFQYILQQDSITTKSTTNSTTHVITEEKHDLPTMQLMSSSCGFPVTKEEKHENLVSLRLGRTTSIDVKNVEETRILTPNKEKETEKKIAHEKGLALGLDYCKFERGSNKEIILSESSKTSPEKGIEEVNEDTGETSKSQKNLKRNVEDEISQENPTKRVRVSLRVRCDTPTMNDGCQWRKYGQKIAKGNPCPRAYYRCTVAANCPVRKQVQRCAEDMTILITTYEGTHNHPLPVAATAIASTTSAAARMFLSGSSTSSSSANTSNQTYTTPSTNINGLNYYLSSDNSKAKPFYLPNSSISSPTSSFPTITLDLTSTPSSSFVSPLTRMSTFSPRYPSTNLDFSCSESNVTKFSWSTNGVLSYGASNNSSKNSNNQTNSLNFQKQPFIEENIYQPYTLEEATKAITLDPKFQSALAMALSSIIGSNGRNNHGSLVENNENNKPTSQNLRIGDQSFPNFSSFATTQNPSNYQSGSRFSLDSSPSFPVSKSKSTSPDVNRDHNL